jgi:hypothetical protein
LYNGSVVQYSQPMNNEERDRQEFEAEVDAFIDRVLATQLDQPPQDELAHGASRSQTK